MNDALLDRPVWHALATRHACFAEGGPLALRYRADMSPFAATAGDTPDALREIADMAARDGELVFLQRDPVAVPPGTVAGTTAMGVQMVASAPMPFPDLPDVVELGEDDGADMLALATLTKPGPFLEGTRRFGGFVGIRDRGRLVAMAGERLKVAGFTEVSGVCTHPDWRGRGYAGLLSRVVAARIAARGETPFLHAFAGNRAAIALYEKIGFRHRCDMHFAVLKPVLP